MEIEAVGAHNFLFGNIASSREVALTNHAQQSQLYRISSGRNGHSCGVPHYVGDIIMMVRILDFSQDVEYEWRPFDSQRASGLTGPKLIPCQPITQLLHLDPTALHDATHPGVSHNLDRLHREPTLVKR